MQLLSIDRNYSVSMMLAVQPTLEFVSIPHNVTYLTGIIAGSEIGLHGNMLSVSTTTNFGRLYIHPHLSVSYQDNRTS